MAADFLTDKQTQNYGRYAAEPNGSTGTVFSS